MNINENNNIILNMENIPTLPDNKVYNIKTKRINSLKSAINSIKSGKYNKNNFFNEKLLS